MSEKSIDALVQEISRLREELAKADEINGELALNMARQIDAGIAKREQAEREIEDLSTRLNDALESTANTKLLMAKEITEYKIALAEAEQNVEHIRSGDRAEDLLITLKEREHQLAGVVGLLEESQVLLWHTKCKDDNATKCPACSLECRIEEALANLT